MSCVLSEVCCSVAVSVGRETSDDTDRDRDRHGPQRGPQSGQAPRPRPDRTAPAVRPPHGLAHAAWPSSKNWAGKPLIFCARERLRHYAYYRNAEGPGKTAAMCD